MFNLSFKKTTLNCLLIALPLCGLWNIAQATYIPTKAYVAQILLETAWQETLEQNSSVKPWPWADTWPVARLTVPRLDLHRIVLAGANGSALAFGPGHLFNSHTFSSNGNSIVAGHRDTHFAFLSKLKLGDEIKIERDDGVIDSYKVSQIYIADENDTEQLYADNSKQLTLITCYPFTAIIPGGPLRYIVQAIPHNTPSGQWL